MIRAADLLELAEVKNETLKVIEDHISFDTYLDIRDVGNVFNCPRLLEAVDRFVLKNFAEFVRKPAFFELEESRLKDYLRCDQLRTETEEDIFTAVREYCKRGKTMNESFVELASLVRFELLSTKFVLKQLRRDEEIRENARVSNFLLDKLQSLNLLHANSRPRFSTRVLVAMPYRSKTFFHVSFSGDGIEFAAKKFPKMIESHIDALINYSVCKVGDGRMYLAGGLGYSDNNEAFQSPRGYMYDVVDDSWSPSSELRNNAGTFTMASVGNSVYVMSSDQDSATDEVLKMDFSLNLNDREWVHVARTLYHR